MSAFTFEDLQRQRDLMVRGYTTLKKLGYTDDNIASGLRDQVIVPGAMVSRNAYFLIEARVMGLIDSVRIWAYLVDSTDTYNYRFFDTEEEAKGCAVLFGQADPFKAPIRRPLIAKGTR